LPYRTLFRSKGEVLVKTRRTIFCNRFSLGRELSSMSIRFPSASILCTTYTYRGTFSPMGTPLLTGGEYRPLEYRTEPSSSKRIEIGRAHVCNFRNSSSLSVPEDRKSVV